MQTSEIIVIAGPTASGKSGLALALAEQLDGVVINADSMFHCDRNIDCITHFRNTFSD